MFKPARILQVGSFTLMLMGCANTQTTALSAQPSALPTPAAPAETVTTTSSPITSGTSIVGNTPLQLANGELSANIRSYAQAVAQQRNIPVSYIETILKSARYNATAAKLMAPSQTRIRRSWVTYRNRFVEPVRINAGEKFWMENQVALDKAAQQYGVPPSIIVAIIGVETVYGRNTGNFRVLDALATLGFRYPDSSKPERSQLFRDQLADLIQLDYEKKLDALSVTGSFAGAMGLPQFMPGSLMRYAADGNNDGRIDLLYSVEDAISSVARFLVLHGWVPGLPVFAPVALPAAPQALVVGGLYPTMDWQTLQQAGAQNRPISGNRIQTSTTVSPWKDHKLGVVDLVDEPRKQAEYRVGTPNFFALTHYNRSYFYATSVADLAQALAGKTGYGWPN